MINDQQPATTRINNNPTTTYNEETTLGTTNNTNRDPSRTAWNIPNEDGNTINHLLPPDFRIDNLIGYLDTDELHRLLDLLSEEQLAQLDASFGQLETTLIAIHRTTTMTKSIYDAIASIIDNARDLAADDDI